MLAQKVINQKMEKLSPHLSKEPSDNRGINIVDLMMWLVIAALLLAAAIQAIGYYQQAAKVYLMQDEVTGVVAKIHAASAIEGESVSEDTIRAALEEHNNAHAKDDTAVSYGLIPASAIAAPSIDGTGGFTLASFVASASPSEMFYLQANSESVEHSYVVYFFHKTNQFKHGLTVVRKNAVDGGGLGEVVTPGAPAVPAEEPTATPTATPTEDPVAGPVTDPEATTGPTEEPTNTPTPTDSATPVPEETIAPSEPPVTDPTPTPSESTGGAVPEPEAPVAAAEVPVVAAPTGPSITSSSDIVAFDSAGALWNYRSATAADKRFSIGATGAAIPDDFYVTDWNIDGVMDLVVKGKDGSLTVRKGLPSGGFSNLVIGNAGWNDYEITVGKFKKADTRPSIIAKQISTGVLYHYPNPSGGAHGVRVEVGSGGWGPYTPLNLVDWDRDGNMDIIARNASNQMMLYRTNGAGAFIAEARQTIGTGWNSNSIHVMNGRGGTGNVGLMVRSATNNNLIYYPINKNAFGAYKVISGGWGTYKIAGN